MKIREKREILASIETMARESRNAQALWKEILENRADPDFIPELKVIAEDLLTAVNKWKSLIPA
jgi:hypothetical protein